MACAGLPERHVWPEWNASEMRATVEYPSRHCRGTQAMASRRAAPDRVGGAKAPELAVDLGDAVLQGPDLLPPAAEHAPQRHRQLRGRIQQRRNRQQCRNRRAEDSGHAPATAPEDRVKEHWMIDPTNETVSILGLRGGALVVARTVWTQPDASVAPAGRLRARLGHHLLVVNGHGYSRGAPAIRCGTACAGRRLHRRPVRSSRLPTGR